MKRIFLLICPCFLISGLAAQSQAEVAPEVSDTFAIGAEFWPPERVVYDMFDIDKPPVFPGGVGELLKYVAENLHYPAGATEADQIGMISMSFVVESDGSLSAKKILRGLILAPSALDLLDKMPRWSPAIKNGQPVAVRFVLPIRF